MNLDDLKTEIQSIASGESTDLETYLTSWINEAILQIATDFHLPALKATTYTGLTCTNATWLYNMPSDFHKNLFMARDSENTAITITTMDALQERDWEHTETGDHVTAVAVQATQIGVYPMANETIRLWYYSYPTELEYGDDECTCIPKEFHRRLIIPKVMLILFSYLQDMALDPPAQSLMFWQAKYDQGLHGSLRGDLGFIHWLSRHSGEKPKRYLRRDHIGAM